MAAKPHVCTREASRHVQKGIAQKLLLVLHRVVARGHGFLLQLLLWEGRRLAYSKNLQQNPSTSLRLPKYAACRPADSADGRRQSGPFKPLKQVSQVWENRLLILEDKAKRPQIKSSRCPAFLNIKDCFYWSLEEEDLEGRLFPHTKEASAKVFPCN